MFDIVRNNKKIVQGFLALIMLPFAFWGVDSYVRNADVDNAIATVDDRSITEQELQIALREQQDRLRAQLGGRVDAALFQSPQMRRAVLDSLINQRLMERHAREARLAVSDADLARFIAAVPALQENGQFSKARYEALVAAQGMSKEMFEARVRQDMAMQQLLLPVTEAGIVGQASSRRWIAAQLEQRDVAEIRLMPDAYLPQVKLSADAAQKYYEDKRKQFELPEQLRAEFLVLSQDALSRQFTITDDEIKARYATKAERYTEGEMRRASHILIRVAADAPDAEVKAARAKAEALLTKVKAAADSFETLAKANSEDPGSAEKGGDLDWFSRGMMVKPFEDAVFTLKTGGVSDVVRSDFGFHIIRLTDVRAERAKPLADVRAEIIEELKTEAATKQYAEAAESFSNTVYEQADSLVPAADKWKLQLRQSDWLVKGSKLPPPFDNAKLNAALFSEDAIKNRRNTEAVEVSPGILVAARVLDHKPAALQAFNAVKVDIEKQLQREEAQKLAIKDGEDKLVRMSKGESVDVTWPVPRSLSRLTAQGMAPDAVRAVFKADAAKLPAYAGVVLPGNGYALYRISAVRSADGGGAAQAGLLAQQYARVVAEEEFSAWLATLKEKYPVAVINKPVPESK